MIELLERDKARIVDGIPEANLVLYYSGLQGRGATLYDRSRYANHGTIVGATWQRLPSGLYALRYNGTSHYTTVVDSVSLRLLGDMTFVCWLNWSNWADTNYETFLEKGNHDANGINYIFGRLNSGSGRALKFTYSDGSFRDVAESSGWTATNGVWNCLAIVVHKATSTVDFYRSGALLSSVIDANALNYPTNSENLCISRNNISIEFFPGTMGELLLISRALTAAEVLRIYNSNKWKYR